MRFIVRKSFELPDQQEEARHEAIFWKEHLRQYHQIKANEASSSTKQGINVAFRQLYGIDFDRLLGDSKPNFFLFFIPAGCEDYEQNVAQRQALQLRTSKEHDLVADFLHTNGAEVFSLQNLDSCRVNKNGSWDYFGKWSQSMTTSFVLR